MKWVEDRLREWSDWARGHQFTKRQMNPIAAMIRIAAGEIPGRDLSVPYELTRSVEITDKAIARLKKENARQKRIIMRYWLGRVPLYEIGAELRVSDERAKEMLMRAHLALGRHILELESLTTCSQGRNIGHV